MRGRSNLARPSGSVLNSRLGRQQHFGSYNDAGVVAAGAARDHNNYNSQIETEKGNSESYYYDEEDDDEMVGDDDPNDDPEELEGEACSYQRSRESEEDDYAEEIVDNRRFNRR